MTIGERIKEARNMAGVTQERLAFTVGVKRTVISKYESGLVDPTANRLSEIASTLKVPVSYFYGESSKNREIPEQSTDEPRKVTAHAAICSDLTALYERKNHDYGDSFGKGFAEYGMTMPCIRLEDKLNRLKSLLKSGAQVKDESIDDTLMDLANYAIMTLIERKEST